MTIKPKNMISLLHWNLPMVKIHVGHNGTLTSTLGE